MATQAPLITIGIDVGGSRKGFDAVALTDGAYTAQLHCRDVQELVHWCRERIGASVIAMDAPCCWSTTGNMRPCERELMRRGIFCFATPSLKQAERHPSNYYGRMLRGDAQARQKRPQRLALLQQAGIDTTSLTSIDRIDSALCALAAHHLASGRPCQAYGEPATGLIIVPQEPA